VKDEWDEIYYPALSEQENAEIRRARRRGYADFFQNTDDGDKRTLAGAKGFLNGTHDIRDGETR
jgi:hypothetical protein